MSRDDAAALPDTLNAGGITRLVTAHLQRQAVSIHDEITLERLISVLNNWVVRGIRHDCRGRQSIAFLGWIAYGGGRRLMRVAVSIDDQRIISAFLDTTATEKLNSGDMEYFQRNYEGLEVRDEPDRTL